MELSKILEGLQTLQPFYDGKEYVTGAEHDVLYAYATKRPLPPELVQKMVDLGWFQEDEEGLIPEGEEFAAKHYSPEESWTAYT